MIDEKMIAGLAKSKGMKNLMSSMEKTSAYLMMFAQTYMGIYKGKELVAEGDRHRYGKWFEELLERTGRIEEQVSELNKRIDSIENTLDGIQNKLDNLIKILEKE